MTFGSAIAAMRRGYIVRRAGWNGTGMHVYLEDWLEGALSFSGRKYEPCLVLYTSRGTYQPGWLASQADMLADDWERL